MRGSSNKFCAYFILILFISCNDENSTLIDTVVSKIHLKNYNLNREDKIFANDTNLKEYHLVDKFKKEKIRIYSYRDPNLFKDQLQEGVHIPCPDEIKYTPSNYFSICLNKKITHSEITTVRLNYTIGFNKDRTINIVEYSLVKINKNGTTIISITKEYKDFDLILFYEWTEKIGNSIKVNMK